MRERLLVRHFLRRLVENDLISPEADRHEVLGVVCAALTTAGLFGTAFISVKYQFSPLQLPGWTSLAALSDLSLFVGASMIVMALAAVSEWDALGLDARDASILGPLPLPHGMLVRAKLAAIALFTVAFAIALNAVPSLIYPVLLSSKLPIPLVDLLALMPAHLVVTAAAGAFGFLGIVAVRELLRAVTGATLFGRLSSVLQAALLVGLATALLLLPRLSSDLSEKWLSPASSASRTLPPVWFVGLHEWIAGGLIDQLPRRFPAETAPNYDGIVQHENDLTRSYRSHRAEFAVLGRAALLGLGVVAIVAFGLSAWNARRLPTATASMADRRGQARLALDWLVRLVLVRRPSAQGGFFFTLQTLGRSAPHRAALVVAGASSLAIGVLSAKNGVPTTTSEIPLTTLAVQSMFVIVLVAGIRHAARIPADTRAGWIFRLAWSGHGRDYLLGVKLATLLAVLAPTVLILLPVHAVTLGWSVALTHAALGLTISAVVVETAFFRYAKVPFAFSYEPSGNQLGRSPIYVVVFLAVTFGLAWVERSVLGSLQGTLILFAVLCGTAFALWLADRAPTSPIDWDDVPMQVTQRLSLNE
jgi:hypothetical protein